MDDFQGLLARDFGLRPQGKAAPMSAARAAASSGSAWSSSRSASASAAAAATAPPAPSYDDLFGAAAPSAPPPKGAGAPSPNLDDIFDSFKEPSAAAVPPKPKHSSMPVFDKPVYDDDIFDGVPGVKSSSARFDDVFGGNHAPPPAYDDLLGGFGSKPEVKEVQEEKRKPELAATSAGFDDLIPGFGGRVPMRSRETVGTKEKNVPMSKPTSMASDPFDVLGTTSTSKHTSSGIFTDPLDELGRPAKPQGKKHDNTADSGLCEDSSTFNQVPKSEPLFTSELNDDLKDRNGSTKDRDSSPAHNFSRKNTTQQPSVENFENIFPKSHSARYSDVHVDIGASGSEKYSGNGLDDQSPRSDESEDEIWLTVSEIPLFTQPTSAPPPSRTPPPLAVKQKPHGSQAKRKDDDYPRRSNQNYNHHRSSSNQAGVSSIDELEDFARGKSQRSAYDNADPFNEEEFEHSSSAAASAAAMKEAMDKAEAKFKHAKVVRERERDAKLRNREQQEQDDEVRFNTQDHEERERQERLEREREMRQREEKEREQRRFEEERELEKQRERERAARQAVERATKEARERAAAEARAKAEREARQRAERAAVQRAQQEARERAAVEARERAERAAAEAKDRAAAEAKEKAATQARDRAAAERAAVERAQQEARRRAERAAVERAASEVRERQAAEAQERQAAAVAAAAAREKQSKPDDLESFFGMGARANSAPKQRAPTVDPMFNSQTQNRGAATSASASMRKASSTTNIADDLSAIFGGAPTSSEEFQEIEGETEERRRARFDRHQRTRERAAKALAEKNERDMQVQREQAERHRISETMDFEIKRWAAGKEGNLRALLSTLQYVLWPECGWQPVSLTDLITAAAVKKVYRKATLCIHPDKVQQKGANLQQKYIAEKVFDLLKEAWNKFNSEELF
ncbi:auxilin-related protein 2-like [Oryza brachyantha]|uniref:auxilin-related protein 2-like n=1 Tax=Oryza brachyantha TaxID=4533 RepID=UPI001ADB2938|nr:auxilin-related protein 2-like [Oryza brachyantha]